MTRLDLHEVEVRAVALDRLNRLLGPERAGRFTRIADAASARLEGRRVVNVNSTARGGGVAELLQTLLAYARGAGVDTRWLVIDGDPAFFAITKRMHNLLYGSSGDLGALGTKERAHYEETLRSNAARLRSVVEPGDIVILHDPHTAGLAPHLAGHVAGLVWRCHVGLDTQNEQSERAWAFLRPYLDDVDAFVYSRAQFAPPWVPRDRLTVIQPSIDPFSAKNEPMEAPLVGRMLRQTGLLRDDCPDRAVSFARRAGNRGHVAHRVDLLGTDPLPDPSVPVVLQASRWDTVKDMAGVMQGFAQFVAPCSDAHLVLAGPEAHGVADDPEASVVIRDCVGAWTRLPEALRRRVHLACVPMADGDEAAATVNALQRHASVVVQKSLAEGFGLTVTEAMWKSRPVVGSAVGGIVDQIVPGETGALVDAHDLEQYAAAVCSMLADRSSARRMGDAGRERVRNEFLGDRHLAQWADVFDRLVPS